MITFEGPINILLVDDHPDNLLALEAVLGDLNYNLVKCMSGEEALRHLLKDDFAVIVLDVQMPGMDGFETAKLIKARERTKEIPIIFITATSKETEHFHTGYAVGAIDYMTKPFVPQILRTKIEGFVNMYISNKKLQLQTDLLHQKTKELEKMNKELLRTAYQLTKTEAQARVIRETSIDTMITFDEEGRMMTVNPALERMFGYTEADVLDKPITLLVPGLSGIDILANANGSESNREGGRLMEVMPVRSDGTTFFAELQIGVAVVDSERIFACTISDVTEQKLFERKLMEAKEAAEIAARAKTDFLAMVSHEIRTPMNGVIGMSALLLETDMNEEQKEYVEIIGKSGEALLLVINDILDYSKIESGKMEIEEVPFELSDCIGETFDLFTVKTKKQDLEMGYTIDPLLDMPIVSDVTKLRQVLINLVGNAVKFTSEGSIRVNAKLLNDYGSHLDIQLRVEDTGVGIPEDKLPLLFQPFSQLDSSMSRKYGGTGLGLAICKNLIELMGGTISVETERKQGAAFVFTIRAKRLLSSEPIVDTARFGPSPDQPVSFSDFLSSMEEAAACDDDLSGGSSALSRIPPEGRGRILVAEDNEVNQKLALLMLEKLGLDADIAENGRQALALLAVNRYDLVLMDMQMPVLDGIEATRLLFETFPNENCPPIVAMTANVLPEDKEKCLAAGMSDFLSKPIRLDGLRSLINRFIALQGSNNKQPAP
ncbi:histidine kinase [Paenibacillus darwinianus]|uniref:Circadian input-output histidine kinase CikA n=1 Tax=Paenibacillus darwinianus TaxID=1380763 RepID=A0A9W5RYX3_9BACL|nr:response regulator [Paenibacillus darwinianus]EXX86026.1 histidine kinase [Paenibacillus darwinianus]EXX86157.1 histidine kinase [Paenibacillus darwinianus]EXX86484.1 histidine kinase [Paenibacillus darwinianus]